MRQAFATVFTQLMYTSTQNGLTTTAKRLHFHFCFQFHFQFLLSISISCFSICLLLLGICIPIIIIILLHLCMCNIHMQLCWLLARYDYSTIGECTAHSSYIATLSTYGCVNPQPTLCVTYSISCAINFKYTIVSVLGTLQSIAYWLYGYAALQPAALCNRTRVVD